MKICLCRGMSPFTFFFFMFVFFDDLKILKLRLIVMDARFQIVHVLYSLHYSRVFIIPLLLVKYQIVVTVSIKRMEREIF